MYEMRTPTKAMPARLVAVYLLSASVAALIGCDSTDSDPPAVDGGIQWVRSAAEYKALSLQAYQAAAEDLQKFLDDKSWSALPDQENAEDLPVAIIADIDETTVSNVEFQATFARPFANHKLDSWNAANKATPVPGMLEFTRKARALDVEVFYVTNRPCEPKRGSDDPCPQKSVTLQDLREAGIETDATHVSLSNERPDWDREKVVRRNHIAKTHRVIMLFGDDLSDFVACARVSPKKPCTEAASTASRNKLTYDHSDYWGEGWYMMPNPMHGSWTSAVAIAPGASADADH